MIRFLLKTALTALLLLVLMATVSIAEGHALSGLTILAASIIALNWVVGRLLP